jgi:sugar phosphate permease
LIAAICLYATVWVGTDRFWVAYVLLVIAGAALYTPYGPFFAAIAEILPKNVAGGAIGLINSLGALGSFIGSYLVGYLNTETGNFNASYTLMSVALVLATIITIAVIPAPKVLHPVSEEV